ncbi:hypothetical protein KR032_007346 [Drosophila birchii]|nr:hypothetical protein KR032_007346 [Drosophila birchii]
MVNIHSGTRMMVKRYIELLRARIQCAPTRHIADRHRRLSSRRSSQHLEQAVKERQKTDAYNKNKRRSMWNQTGRRLSEPEDQKREDANQYRPKELEERTYYCTWNDFPENMVEQHRTTYVPHVEEEAPKRRRSPGERPGTAKPFDAEATAFLNQWDNNTAQINRNNFLRSTDSCPRPVVNNDEYLQLGPKRKFHF